MNAKHIRDFVVVPTLAQADAILRRDMLHSDAAVELILRTMAHESHFRHLAQIGGK